MEFSCRSYRKSWKINPVFHRKVTEIVKARLKNSDKDQ